MTLLVIILFLYGAGSQPEFHALEAPSASACAIAAPKMKARLEADTKVRDAEVFCVTQKDKV